MRASAPSAPLVGLLAAATALPLAAQPAPPPASVELPAPERIRAVRGYIKKTWTTLRRSTRDLPAAAKDPKLHLPAGTPWPVYLPATEDKAKVEKGLRAELGDQQLATLALRPLPADWRDVKEHGLLYLPHPYVVPGGRFNE